MEKEPNAMKSRFIVFVSLALTLEAVVALTVGAGARAANERRSEKVPAAVNAPVSGTSPVAPVGAELDSATAVLGRCALTRKSRDGESPCWLDPPTETATP